MSAPRGRYRNTPGGMNGMSTNLKPGMQPVALEDIAIMGSRAQRRWATRQLKEINSKRAARDGR